MRYHYQFVLNTSDQRVIFDSRTAILKPKEGFASKLAALNDGIEQRKLRPYNSFSEDDFWIREIPVAEETDVINSGSEIDGMDYLQVMRDSSKEDKEDKEDNFHFKPNDWKFEPTKLFGGNVRIKK